MITLITGLPGTGKTAYAVQLLDELRGQRPVYANITGLRLDHNHIDDEWMRRWYEHVPEDALIIYDEAQRVFRPRAPGASVPDYVASLETHRHRGVDIILITQRYTLIDAHVRGLVGRHIHIRQTALARTVHESPEVVDYSQRSVRAEAASRPYRISSRVKSLYTSAEHHTVQTRRRLPTAFYVAGASIILLIGAGYYVYNMIDSKTKQPEPAHHATPDIPNTPVGTVNTSAQTIPENLTESLTPADPYNPLSAPIYQHVAVSVTPPQIIGCIASRTRCVCYTQQGTTIWVPDDQCRDRAEGRYYDPYRSQTAYDYGHRAQYVGPTATAAAGAAAPPHLAADRQLSSGFITTTNEPE